MNLKIISDFTDLWHSAFDHDGYPFRMVSTDGPNRPQMIDIFKHAGIKTPLFGYYPDFVKWEFSPYKRVVVYRDITKHNGEGKILKAFGALCCDDRAYHMMEHIPYPDLYNTEYYSKSTRYLIVGDRCFTYDYMSKEDWRSNYGEGDITEPKEIEVPLWRYCIYYPIFAIDFVDDSGILKAVDLNIAPGLTGVHLSKLISGTEMVNLIKKWFNDTQRVFDYFGDKKNG